MSNTLQMMAKNGQVEVFGAFELSGPETRDMKLRRVKETTAKQLVECDDVWEVIDHTTVIYDPSVDPLAYPTIGVKINIVVPRVKTDEP